MFKTLRVTNKKSNHENDCSSSPSSPLLPTSASASDTDPSSTSTESTDVDTSESLLPGVKLPRTEAEWTEANDYFRIHRSDFSDFGNLNDVTIKFQNFIYNYFATNYGIIESPSTIKGNNSNKSIKILKKELKQLKFLGHNNNNFDKQISEKSKAIRFKLKSKKSAPNEKTHDISTQLKQRFWKTCKSQFNKSTIVHILYYVEQYRDKVQIV
ncbi:hypothetical protein HELRODRAFT_184340 [Helobdella robusta]|uniref:Uncharacterized protein n=1 Tax=Helobdella robusta TaxID=6412 RepID=T1FL11_HELRO|nr:hypothetical protein HELRODRAFT_184340 [Helobdella robusta]ESO00987.1 hypothetical protein HELRODRAFT_184340 [Helobdella robusta]